MVLKMIGKAKRKEAQWKTWVSVVFFFKHKAAQLSR